MSDCLRPHGLQHIRLPCPSLSPRVCWNSRALSRGHPIILSSVTLFSSCTQPFPVSGSFPISQLFTSGDQSIGASASLLLMSIQGYYHLGLTNLISLKDSQESSPAPQFKDINSPALSLLYGPTFTSLCDYWKKKTIVFAYMGLCQQNDVFAL